MPTTTILVSILFIAFVTSLYVFSLITRFRGRRKQENFTAADADLVESKANDEAWWENEQRLLDMLTIQDGYKFQAE